MSAVVGSVYTDQNELLKSLVSLYLEEDTFSLDATFNKGGFYTVLRRPEFIGDINPQFRWCPQMDVTALPVELWNLKSAIFDPPFLVGGSNHMAERYGFFESVSAMFAFLDSALLNFHRVLCPGGVLVVKCQDTSVGRQNYFTHIHISNVALLNGFELLDLFVLFNDHVITSDRPSRMARKQHSFFLVFKKVERKIRVPKF